MRLLSLGLLFAAVLIASTSSVGYAQTAPPGARGAGAAVADIAHATAEHRHSPVAERRTHPVSYLRLFWAVRHRDPVLTAAACAREQSSWLLVGAQRDASGSSWAGNVRHQTRGQ